MLRRPIEIDDLYAIRLVADPNISPDGSTVAWVVTTVDRNSNGYKSNIWCMVLPDGRPYRLTTSSGKDTSPRWSPDGTMLAFLSDRSGKNQVYVLYADGGEAWQVSDGPNGAGEIAWSADSTTLVWTSKVEPTGNAPTSDVRVIKTMRYKMDGEGFYDGKRRHVHMAQVSGGSVRVVTDGDWDSTQPALCPDGKNLAFVSNRSEHRHENAISDIWLADLSTGRLTRLTDERGQYSAPSWSPDGQHLAWFGHPVTERYGPTTLDDVHVYAMTDGTTTTLFGALDLEPGNTAISDSRYGVPAATPTWSADGQTVYTMVSDAGNVDIYACPLDGVPSPRIAGIGDIQSFTVANDGTMAYAASTMRYPTEVFVAQPNADAEQVSHVNDTFMQGIALGEVDEVRFESDPGVEVHGWLLKPPGFNPSVKYPAIIEIHGGPHGMYGVGFFHELHVLAARGYVVLYTNPRGSTGYGQEHVAGTLGDWGGADYRDVMAGVPFLESLPYVDARRLGVTGGSYGGYMTNWIIGQTTRFKAAVTQRSTANRISTYGTSDMNMTYNDWEFAGTPYDNPEHYLERSPLTYVKRVETPLLIIHSENDLRCPITQGEELFVALRKLGKTAEFVRFPNESHGLSRAGQPCHRIERLERICAWFDQYL